MKFNRKAERIIRELDKNRVRSYFVGGCVRDNLMGRIPKDFDIVACATPDEVKAILERIADHFLEVGAAFGIVIAVVEGEPFEIASARRDIGGTDGRHPDSVENVREIEIDLARRDFTMNAIAWDPIRGTMIDPFCGGLDIHDRVIDFVGDAAERIREDKLRILRAIRFQSQLGFGISEEALIAINADHDLTGVSQERITAELAKTLTGDHAVEALRTMRKTGILWDIIPELVDLLQAHDSPWHLEFDDTGNSIWAHVNSVFAHACDLTKDEDCDRKLKIRLAALLHDIGKPSCRGPKDGHSNFHGHDHVGAKMAREVLVRMKFTNDVRDTVTELVRMHMMHHDIQKVKKVHKARKLLGRRDIDDILLLGEADTRATINGPGLEKQDRTMEAVVEWRKRFPVMLPDPIVTGDDLILEGAKPGPDFKVALERAFDQQLNGVIDKRRLVKFALGELSK